MLYRRGGRLFNEWEYLNEAEKLKIKVDGNRVSNDTDIVKRWAVSGKGIVCRAKIDVISELQSGALVEVLSQYQSPQVELHLVCPNREQVTPAVIALRELLRKLVKQQLNNKVSI